MSGTKVPDEILKVIKTWETKKSKSNLFNLLDTLYETYKFDHVGVYEGDRCYHLIVSKDGRNLMNVLFYDLPHRHRPPFPDKKSLYTRGSWLVEWLKKRPEVKHNKIPIGEANCALCGVKITQYYDTSPVCKKCMDIYNEGLKVLQREKDSEDLSFDFSPDHLDCALSKLMMNSFKEFMKKHAYSFRFRKGAKESLRLLEDMCDAVVKYYYTKGVIDGKSLLHALNEGDVSLSQFEEMDEKMEKITGRLNDLCEKLYGKAPRRWWDHLQTYRWETE